MNTINQNKDYSKKKKKSYAELFTVHQILLTHKGIQYFVHLLSIYKIERAHGCVTHV